METPLTRNANSGAGATARRFNGTSFDLNSCFFCDEIHCSPTFIGRCAGANRRTAGVVTDIERPGAAVCAAARSDYAAARVQGADEARD